MIKDNFSVKTKVYLLFFFSGISGLIYETVWLRMLIRTLGSTVYATSIVLAAFMAGMAIGSFLFGRYCLKKINYLRLYAFLEFGIGFSAIALIFLFRSFTPFYKIIYSMLGQQRFMLTIAQSAMMFFVFLIPAALMGGTLPVLAVYTKKYHPIFSQRLGYLYGLNTFGATLGVLGSGIYFIGELGETATLTIGILINLCVSLVAFSIAKTGGNKEGIVNESVASAMAPPEIQKISRYSDTTRKLVLVAYALSGFTAMSYEIVWTRMLQIHVGTSIYAFSLMLTFYLAGIGLGSIWGGRYIAKHENPLRIFGTSELFIAFYSILGMYLLASWKPRISNEYFIVADMLAGPACVIFPITFVLGLIFPAVSKIYVKDEAEAGSSVGRIYSVNTTGCIFGSLICGFLFIWLLGTRNTMLLLACINAAIGIIMLYRAALNPRSYAQHIVTGTVLVAIIVVGLFAPDPYVSSVNVLRNLIYGPYAKDSRIYFQKEDVAATTTAIGIDGLFQSKRILINGTMVTHLCTETKLMAHLPILSHPDPKDVLVVCFGMGTTLRSVCVHKNIKCDVVDLVPQVFQCFQYFHSDGPAILSDPRVHPYIDDGRNFLLLSDKKYDIITVDPSPPIWAAGTVNLYTKDFFNLCKEHLNNNGIMCLWVPPSRFSEAIMIMRTFYEVFPNTYVYKGVGHPGVYLLGINGKNVPQANRFIRANEDKDIIADLNEFDNKVPSPEAILNLLVLTPDQLAVLVKGFRVITDDFPYTEFPMWRSIFDKAYTIQLTGDMLEFWRKWVLKE